MSQRLDQRPRSKTKHQVSCDASTKEKSKSFIKQMIALPISSIVYLRGIFGEEHFSKRFINNLEIKMLKDPKSVDDNAHMMIEWMRGVFDALDKDYLKSVTLTIHDPADPRENPIESYTFSVEQKDGDTRSISMQRNGEDLVDAQFSEENLKVAAINCLTKLCDACNVLETLPDEVVLNMELAYNDERTPKEYEPPGFQPSRPKLRGDAEEVGEVETRFHRLRVKVYARQLADLSQDPKISESSTLSCRDYQTSTVGVVSPTVRPIPMETEPPVSSASEPPCAVISAAARPTSLNSTREYNDEAMSHDGLGARVDTSGSGRGGRGKASAGKRGKRKAIADSPSEKNSETGVQKSAKRARK